MAGMLMKWDASKHPRAKAGGPGGGRFAPLSYDAKRNVGAGYGSKQGDSRVKQAQTALNRLKIADMNGKALVLDGKLGPKTTSALKAWQRKNGMKADGRITPELLAKLKATKSAHQKKHLVKKSPTAKPPTPKVAMKPPPKAPAITGGKQG